MLFSRKRAPGRDIKMLISYSNEGNGIMYVVSQFTETKLSEPAHVDLLNQHLSSSNLSSSQE